MHADVSRPIIVSAQSPSRPVLYVSSPFLSPTCFFRPLVVSLSLHFTLRCTSAAAPPPSECCDLFLFVSKQSAFLAMAASSASSFPARDQIDQRVERLKSTHQHCIVVAIGQDLLLAHTMVSRSFTHSLACSSVDVLQPLLAHCGQTTRLRVTMLM